MHALRFGEIWNYSMKNYILSKRINLCIVNFILQALHP
uniref:Uncharacterized protein n=1 Tax=Siphoviridae sp. ctYh54 TaxID=2826379 RepID=A0A8S5ME34_9CAUD|nr:MAG TPA: hypothetical protein [Siphoviridae sp. ctYh54]